MELRSTQAASTTCWRTPSRSPRYRRGQHAESNEIAHIRAVASASCGARLHVSLDCDSLVAHVDRTVHGRTVERSILHRLGHPTLGRRAVAHDRTFAALGSRALVW